jgi:hypothetical protein
LNRKNIWLSVYGVFGLFDLFRFPFIRALAGELMSGGAVWLRWKCQVVPFTKVIDVCVPLLWMGKVVGRGYEICITLFLGQFLSL